MWRLRHAVHNTCLSGSYLTDVIKDHVDPKAANVLARARKDPSWFETHIRLLKDELKCVGAENAILVAMGAVAHDLLMKAKKEHGLLNDVKKIRHYAWQRSDDAYYQTVRNEIESIGKSSSD